jgi:transcriptional regulator with XRE-family HTH domain
MSSWALGDRLFINRELNGMSQKDLAAEVGLSREAISKFETGHRWLGRDTCVRISRALGVSQEYLLYGDAKTKREQDIDELLTLERQYKVALQKYNALKEKLLHERAS